MNGNSYLYTQTQGSREPPIPQRKQNKKRLRETSIHIGMTLWKKGRSSIRSFLHIGMIASSPKRIAKLKANLRREAKVLRVR